MPKREVLQRNIMNRILKIWITGLTVCCFSACGDKVSSGGDEPSMGMPISFVPTVETQTRGTDFTKDNLTSLGVLAYLTQGSNFNASSSTPNFMYNQEVTKASGASTWEYTPTKFWPTNSNDKITFFAYAPHNPTGLTVPDITATGYPSFTYEVPSTEAAQTDLLLAKPAPNKTANDGKVNFSFKHALTRIVLNVEAGDGFTGITINSLSIKTKKSGTVAFSSITSPTDWMQWSNIATGAGNDISCTATLPSSSSTVTAGNTGKIATFFLLPIAATGNTSENATLTFSYTMNGTVQETKTVTDLPLTSMADWLPATSITYNLKITRTAATVEVSSIDVWSYGSSQDLDATIDNVSAKEGYRAEDLKMGDYYYSDGTTSDGGYRIMENGTTFQYEVAPDAAKTCIGVVFAIGHSQYDGSDYSTTGIGQQKCKAYVIALEDAGNSCKWSNNVNENLGCSSSGEDWNGYKFTQIIINAAGGESNALANSYEAIHYAAVDYKNKISAPASSSGWFLPAIGQLSGAYQVRNYLHGIIPESNEQYRYWSSTESHNGYRAMMLDTDISPSEGRTLSNNKFNSYSSIHIRSVLAF